MWDMLYVFLYSSIYTRKAGDQELISGKYLLIWMTFTLLMPRKL